MQTCSSSFGELRAVKGKVQEEGSSSWTFPSRREANYEHQLLRLLLYPVWTDLIVLLVEVAAGPAPHPEVVELQRDGCIRG